MGTTTPRAGLYKSAAVGEQVSVETQINAAYDKIDNLLGFTPVTSGTRPATPYEGQTIYETDTKKCFVRAAGQWLLVAEDTGWINCTLDPAAVVVDGQTPQRRKINGVVYHRGRVTQGAGASYFMESPVGWRPTTDIRIVVATGGSGTTPSICGWSSAQNMWFTAAGTTVNLSTLIYPADA